MIGSTLTHIATNLGAPDNYTIFDWWLAYQTNSWSMLGQLLGQLVYSIIRFILNIVDFLQFFCQKLVGIDYWLKGNVSVDTLGESDVIFRFLYSDPVQRVFRLMVGVFAVLLIVFTIVAIVKSEYSYVTNNDLEKANNNKGSIFRNALKSIFLVIIMPIILVMGILASNAILASLVNVFNLDNRQTLGSQIFTVSSYQANRYRLYADSNVRQGITNYTNITYQGKTYKIPTALKPVNPTNYGILPFVGFGFSLSGTDYLYEVDTSSSETIPEGVYMQYISSLGGKMLTANECGISPLKGLWDSFKNLFRGGINPYPNSDYIFATYLSELKKKSNLIQMAYNTWNYNELLTRDLEWDKTIAKTEADYVGTSGRKFPEAKYYANSQLWGNYHDGGANGLVAIPDEYYVLADLVDFMVGETVPVSFVNVSNPLIDWDYAGTDGMYLNTDYVHFNGNRLDQFLVYYQNTEPRIYNVVPNAEDEEDGALFIAAYYNEANNQYVPVVNSKVYSDGDMTVQFKSDYLSSNYEGLIVARGLMDSKYNNYRIGKPSELVTRYGSTKVSANDTKYLQLDHTQQQVWLDKMYDVDFGFNSFFAGIDANSHNLKNVSAIDTSNIESANSDVIEQLKLSLPRSINFRYYDTEGTTSKWVEDIDWTLLNQNKTINNISSDGYKYIVFKADKNIDVYIDNSDFNAAQDMVGDNSQKLTNQLVVNSTTIRKVPLYAFVGVKNNSEDVQIMLVYSQYANADNNWFNNITNRIGENIYGRYSGITKEGMSDSSRQSENGLIARVINYQGQGVSLVRPDYENHPETAPQTSGNFSIPSTRVIVYTDINFPSVRTEINDDTQSLLDPDQAIVTHVDSSSSFDIYTTYYHTTIFSALAELTGDLISVNGGKISPVSGSGSATFNSSNYYFDSTRIVKNDDGSQTAYFALYNNDKSLYTFNGATVIVKADCDSAGHVTLTPYDFYNIVIGSCKANVSYDETAKDNGQYEKVERYGGTTPVLIKLYDLTYYQTSNGRESYNFRYNSTLNYILKVKSTSTGDVYEFAENNEKYTTDYYTITFNFYNAFTFSHTENGVKKLYALNTASKEIDERTTVTPLRQYSFVTRPEDIEVSNRYGVDNAGNRVYTIDIMVNDGGGIDSTESIVQFNYQTKDAVSTTSDKLKAIENGYNFNVFPTSGLAADVYSKVPEFSGPAFKEDARNALGVSQYLIFLYDNVTLGTLRFDIHLSITALRFKVNIGSGTSGSTRIYLLVSFSGGNMKVNYNFNSVFGMGINNFYSPLEIQYLVLVFATILVMSVLGKAVWGLIQRIYNITLYFLVMPGVAAAIPLDEGSRYDNWKKKLVPEILGGYGTLIGVNVFFVLMPVIKSASQIFTAADINTSLAQGNWVRLVPVAFLNQLVYMLFLLVAFTLIKTLPGLLSDLVGGSNVYAQGLDTVKNVKEKVVDPVGKVVSGQAAKEGFGNLVSTMRNFVPGSAFYGDIKKASDAHKAKKAAKEAAKAEQAANSAQEANNTQGGGGGGGDENKNDKNVEIVPEHKEPSGREIKHEEQPIGPEGDDFTIPTRRRTQNEKDYVSLNNERNSLLTRWAKGRSPEELAGEERENAIREYNEKQKNDFSKIVDLSDENIRKSVLDYAGLGEDASADQVNQATEAYRAEMARQAWNAEHADNQIVSERQMRDNFMNSRQARMEAIQNTAKAENRSLTKPERDEYERLKGELTTEVDSAAYNRREELREKERNKLSEYESQKFKSLARKASRGGLSEEDQALYESYKSRQFSQKEAEELNELNKRHIVASFTDQRIKDLAGKEAANIISKSEMKELTQLRSVDDLTEKAKDKYNKEMGGIEKTATYQHMASQLDQKIADKKKEILEEREAKRKSQSADENNETKDKDKKKNKEGEEEGEKKSKRDLKREAEVEAVVKDQLKNANTMGSVQAELGQLARQRTRLQNELARAFADGDVNKAADLNAKIDQFTKSIVDKRAELTNLKSIDKAFEKKIMRLEGKSYTTNAADRLKNRHLTQIDGEINRVSIMLKNTSVKDPAHAELEGLLSKLQDGRKTLVAQDSNARYTAWSKQSANAKYGVMTAKQTDKNRASQIGNVEKQTQKAVDQAFKDKARTDKRELQASYAERAGEVKDPIKEKRVANAVRNTFRKDIADLLSHGDGRKYGIRPPKSSVKALEAAKQYRDALEKNMKELIKRMEKETQKDREKTRNEIHQIESKISRISSIAEKANKAAKKQKKNVDELMRDKRSSKANIESLIKKVDKTNK